MRIRLNRIHFPVRVLGPGTRIGLWVQGCTIGCPACISRDTWSRDGGHDFEIPALMKSCRALCPKTPDGVTITGGEPFEQAGPLAEVLDELHRWRVGLSRPFDILCYSGFSLEYLLSVHGELVRRFDAVIPEPYQCHRPIGKLWAGSDNQQLVTFTDLGARRYGRFLGSEAAWKPSLQVSIDEAGVWLLGIPDRHDLDSLVDLCRKEGVRLGGLSWLA